jgi:TonB family protein
MFNLLALILALFQSFAFQIQKRTCDHPAPPEGMHYVCAPQDSCDCHLERDRSEEGQSDNGGVSASSATSAFEPCSARDLKYFVAPAYPRAARQAKKQGTVTAQLVVDTSGTATVKIESGDLAFSEQVVTALKKWRFAPSNAQKTLAATFTFALAGEPTEYASTTVSGSSPLNLVIAATPPLR